MARRSRCRTEKASMHPSFILGAAVAFAAVAAPTIAAPEAAPASKRLDILADAYYDAAARFNPVDATESGDSRFNDQIGMAIAPAVRTRQYALYHGFQDRLRAIPRDRLDAKGQINYDILAYELATELSFERFPTYLLPVSQMDSLPVTLANYANGQSAQPLTTPKQYRDYLHRLAQLPVWIDQAIANMREGVRQGVTEPKAAMESALPQFKKLLSAQPEQSIFYTPVTAMPASFSAADQKDLRAARTSTGWSALPQGDAWYRARVASQTTTTLTPEQIHAIGLKEVARIQGEFAVV